MELSGFDSCITVKN